jgi:hypothetical protein
VDQVQRDVKRRFGFVERDARWCALGVSTEARPQVLSGAFTPDDDPQQGTRSMDMSCG